MKLTDIQKWPKDEPDDPDPTLGWMAARETAAVVAEDRNDVIWDRDTGDLIAKDPTAAAIRALPAPTSAQLLAEAVKRPEVAALVAALELSRGAWANVLDLCLIPERHRSTAEELRDVAAAALAAYRATKEATQ